MFHQKEKVQNKVYLIKNNIQAHRTQWIIFHVQKKKLSNRNKFKPKRNQMEPPSVRTEKFLQLTGLKNISFCQNQLINFSRPTSHLTSTTIYVMLRNKHTQGRVNQPNNQIKIIIYMVVKNFNTKSFPLGKTPNQR